MSELIELKPLKPFIGSYPCALAHCDTIDEQLVEKEGGMIIKEKIPRKKFIGLVGVTRRLTVDETHAFLSGQLPARYEVHDAEKVLKQHAIKPQSAANTELIATVRPENSTVKVPAEMARSLIDRGLAEMVGGPKRRAAA
jgi:hypothetical protein